MLTAGSPLVASSISTSQATLHVCNRGFCFTKKERPLDPSAYHAVHFNKQQSPTKRPTSGSVIDFCTEVKSQNGEVDCELFHILGTERVDEEFEAVECPKGMDCEAVEDDAVFEENFTTYEEDDMGVLELDESETTIGGHRSWHERPQRGKCFDGSGYEFECYLVEILDDGMVLIEDTRAGGVFAAQPKSDFTVKRTRKRRKNPRTPRVVHVDVNDDPISDFRTIRALNMEGF